MRKPGTYFISLILSAIIVFTAIGLTASLVAYINVTPDKAVQLTRDNDILPAVRNEINTYFKERSTASGVPAEVYTEALTDDVLTGIIEENIRQPFAYMVSGNYDGETSIPGLDKNLEEYYKNYAEENDIETDEEFDNSLKKAQASAIRAVSDKCDVFKLKAMYRHKLLDKAGKIYRNLLILVIAAAGFLGLLVLLMLFICRKEKRSVLYWLGISTIIAGAAGTIPSAVLLATDHFTAFSIKQASVFTAYTSTMSGLTSAFMAASIAMLAAGIALVIVYGVLCSKGKDVTPTAV